MDYHNLAEEYLRILNESTKCKEPRMDESIQGEMAVLRYLREIRNPAQPSELSSDRNLSTARIANTLSSMEKKGWIRREQAADDRRKVMVYLTEEGMQRAEEGHQHFLNHMVEIFEWLGEEDAKHFVRLHSRIMEYRLDKAGQELRKS